MSKADISIFMAPTFLILDYDRAGKLAGSCGKIPTTTFTDHLQVTDPGDGTVTHEFYHVDAERMQIHLPFYCATEVEAAAKAYGLTTQRIELKVHEGVKCDIEMIDGFKPKNDVQAGAIAHATNSALGYRRPVALQPGKGKALSVDMPVRIPGGWKPIGQLAVGDTVIAWDGTHSKITGVYPQGRLPSVSVIIGDGRWVRVSNDHLWGCSVDDGPDQVLTTDQIRALKKDGKVVTVPNIIPENTPDVSLAHPPEELGRKCRTDGDITEEEFAPLLNASVAQKEAFLAGLLEKVEGDEHLANVLEYYAFAILSIARSLGYLASLDGFELCWETKPKRLKVSCFVEQAECNMVCIAIDHPDKLFVTKDYIVTHNTVTLIASASALQTRAFVQMAGNIDQWVQAILKWTKCAPEDIYVIKGAASMRKLIEHVDTINPKFILASTRTLVSFAEFCDKHETVLEQNGYPRFDHLLDHFGVGVWCLDEYHFNIEANFGLGLRWSCPVIIPMTATFLNANPKVLQVMDRQYPPETRFGYGNYHKYVHICAIRYSLGVFVSRYVFQGPKGYSHSGVEDHIRRKHMSTFVDFVIWPLLERLYFKIRNPNEKALILCTTVEFVDAMVAHLKKKCKAEGVDVTIGALYGGVDEEQVKIDNDIIVGTLKKGGTGFDVPLLRTAINTVAIKSITENEQNLGRLRELPDPTIDPIYAYLTWDDVPPQVEYFMPRMKHYARLGKTFNIFRIGNSKKT